MANPDHVRERPPRRTDFLPPRFSGQRVDSDECLAHFLAFEDYLHAQELEQNDDGIEDIVSVFKRTLSGTARLWVEGKNFPSVAELKRQFLARFSKNKTHYSHIHAFDNITYNSGDGAEIHFSKIKQAAAKLNYGEAQIKDKFLGTLPKDCRAAVLMSSPIDTDIEQLVEKAQCYLDLQLADSRSKTSEVTFNVEETPSALNNSESELQTLISGMKSLTASVETLHSTLRDSSVGNDPNSKRSSRSPTRKTMRSKSPFRRNSRSPFRSPASSYRNSNFSDTKTYGHPHNYNRSQNRNRSASRGRRPSHIICYYCHKPGHTIANCFQRQAHLQQQSYQAQTFGYPSPFPNFQPEHASNNREYFPPTNAPNSYSNHPQNF